MIKNKISRYAFIILLCLLIALPVFGNELDLARQYATYEWTPTAANINNELYTTLGRSSAFKASQKVTGVAYSWGNWDGIARFEQRINKGEPAGLIYSTYFKDGIETKTPSSLYSQFAGIDCSGFVSQLWGLSDKFGTSNLHNAGYRIPIWDSGLNDVWNKAGSHVMWISSSNIASDIVTYEGYHALGNRTEGKVVDYERDNGWFENNSYILLRKGRDTEKPVLVINNNQMISNKSNKRLKFNISDRFCGEALLKLSMPELIKAKDYQFPRDSLCFEGLKLDKKSPTLYQKDFEISWNELAQFLSISKSMERVCDGKHDLIIRYKDLNESKLSEEKVSIIIDNYKPEVHKCAIESKGASGEPAKIDDIVTIKVDFTEEIKEGSNPKIEIEVEPGQFKTLALEATAWNDNTIDGVKIKRSSFKGQTKMPQHQQSPSSQLEKKLRISGVSGLGTDDQMEPATVTVNGEDIKISADLDYPQANDGSILPGETNADEPQSVFVGVNLEDNESGFTPGEQVNINVEGVGMTTGQVDATGKVQATFQSPVKEGSYPVTVEVPKDKAGNESKEKKKNVGTLKVTKKSDSDRATRPVPPDESLDVFGSVITGNKAPRFGPVKVAIFKSGYAVELSDMLATFGEAADYILPENFSPALVTTYPILLIPSAGLANQTNSANLRDKLTEYVENGGNLIVLTQPTDECYKLLPDQVESLGYFQDKACYWSTAGIRKYTPALAGQSDATLDGTADGVIISWPENAETWLYRLKNNFPALISYQCGQGRVIVSNYYSDYAHGHSQLNRDEKALLRDLLSWGRDFGEIPELKPGEALPVTVPVYYAAGGMEASVARVRLILRNPDRKSVSTREFPLAMAAGETGTVAFDFNDADLSLSKSALGIWWLNYELLGVDGKVVQAEREGQRVALNNGLQASNQVVLAITVNSTTTMALEGTKIPFKIIARNGGSTNRNLTYKVNAVLGSSSGIIIKREEVGSGSWTINNNDQLEKTLEFDAFKAYTSGINNSWAKNWWEFEFFDETGKLIVKELRGVSVYKPAVKTKYELWDLTNPNAAIFKPGDEIRLNYQFENLVPVGYPVQWEVTVKAVNQDQKIIYQKTGSGFIDPVIVESIDFTIPADCSLNKYQVDFMISSNGTVIPTIYNQNYSPTSAINNLSIDNFRTTIEGIKFDLSNKGTTFADYVIISRFQGKKFVEEHFTGTINASTVETLFIPLKAELISPDSILACYLINPATGAERGFIYRMTQKLKFILNSVQQDKDSKNLIYNLTIENPGVSLSGVQLAIFNDALSISKKYVLPDFGQGQKIDYSVEIPLANLSIPNAYPIQFTFCYADGSEVLAYRHYPQINLASFVIDKNGIAFKAINEGALDSDFRFSYEIYNSGVMVCEGELSDLLTASEIKQLNIPINQLNPFIRYHVTGKLIYLSSGQERSISQWIEPLKVELNTPKEQTIVGNKFNYDISLANTGPEFSNLQLTMALSHPALQRDFVIPPLATGATCEFKGELELPGELIPGTYNVTYYLANTSGEKAFFGSGRYTVLAPQLAVSPPVKNEFVPGDSYDVSIVNNGDFSTKVDYELQINDGTGKTVATRNGSVELSSSQEKNLIMPIGADWSSSKYYLNWKLTTSPVRTSLTGYKAFTVKGMETGLAVATDQSIYRTDQSVITQARITNGNYPINAYLDLSVSKLTASGGGERIDGWPCVGGNSHRTNWAKLKGNIQNPMIRWSSGSYDQIAQLIGDMDGDGNNEIIAHNLPRGSGIYILDGSSGHVKAELILETILPSSWAYDITSTLLTDINNDGCQELLVCVDGRYLLAVNGKAEVIWRKDFEETVLSSRYMTVADLNGDGIPELLLDNLVINSQNGNIIRTGSQLGVVADLDNDGKLEVINKTGVYDRDFNLTAQYQQTFTEDVCPVLADLDQDGYLEIILYDRNGLYAFNKDLSLLWFSPIADIEKIAVGDTNGDGLLEIVTGACKTDLNTDQDFLEFNMLSHQGVVIWQNQSQKTDYSNNIYGLVLNDYNGDGDLELIVGSDKGVHIYDTYNGNFVKRLISSSDSLVVGDIDGDHETEIIGGGTCFDDLPVVTEANIIAIPPQEVNMWFSVLNSYEWDPGKILSFSNGNYLTVGNGCISYYQASTETRGIIPLLEVDTAEVIIRNNGVVIEVIKRDEGLLLGIIDPESLNYTQKGETVSDCEPYPPFAVRNEKQYYLKYEYDIYDRITNTILWEKNLSTNAKREIGSLGSYIKNLAVFDGNNLLVSNYNGLYKLSLEDLSWTEIINLPRTIQQFVWVDSQTVILRDNYQQIIKVNLLNNQWEILSSLDDLKEKFFPEIATDLNWHVSGINSQTAYIVSREKVDDYNVYNYNIPTPLYKIDFQTNSYSEITKLKEYGGRIFSTKKQGGNFYFLVTTVFNGIYRYNLDKKEIVNFPLPAHVLQDLATVGYYYDATLAFGPDNNVYLYVDRDDRDFTNACLYSLDPVTGSWSSNLLKAGNALSNLRSDRQDILFGDQPDWIYLLVTNDEWEYDQAIYLYKYIISSDTLELLDQIDYTGAISKIVYDKSNKLFYYNLGDKLKTYQQNGAVNSLTSFKPGSTYLSIVTENNVYFIEDDYIDENYYYFENDRKHWYEDLDIQPTFGLWEYSIDKQKFELISKVPMAYKAKGLSYDPLESKIYFLDGWNIYEYPVNKIQTPVSGNDIYENTGLVYQEKTVAQQRIPVSLASGEAKQLEHTFNHFAEPGSYTLRGRLFNSLDQLIAANQCQFVVSDNGMGLSATGDKRYYRPGENITLSGLLFNTTDIGSGPLKFTVTRSLNGQTTVLREEELMLNPGEQRPYMLNLTESMAGEYLFTVKLTQNGTVVAEAKSLATVAEPRVEVEFDVPAAVGSKPVSASVKLTNKSPYPVSIYAVSELLGLAEPVTLGADEIVLFTKELSLVNDAILLLNITGDIAANYQRTVIFNEKADLAVNLPAQVPASARNIPYLLNNTGSVAAEFPVGLILYRNGAEVAQYNTLVYLNPDQSLAGEWPVELTPGDYRLVCSTLNQTKEINFSCLPDYAATLTATSELTGLDELKININASNTGCSPIIGAINLESDFTKQSIPVEILSGASFTNELSITGLPVITGTYQVKISLEAMGIVLATQTVNFTREEIVPPVPEMVLTDIPINLIGRVGQELPVTVKVRNSGDAAGDCIIELNSEAITFSDVAVINLAPGVEAEHTFKLLIPDEMESGTYHGQVVINEAVTNFQYQINGYKLEAVASLDKAAYLKDETAVLTIAVQNKGSQLNIPLTVRVKQGDFDETREITLGSSSNLTYQIPVTDFNQKIFYGLYHSATGRSLLLDVQNIYEAMPEFTAVPDKQRYQAGEMVNLNVQVNQEGWLAVAGPNDFYRFELVKESKSYAIPLPGDLRTGTYSVWAAFAGKTLEYKIDVIGHDIRFASGKLNQTMYQNGEPFQLDTVVTSGENLTGNALVDLVKPDGTVQPISTKEVQLTIGENRLSFKGTVNSDQTGNHWIRVRFQLGDLTVSRNDYSFFFGKEELLSITCSRTEYFNGTEPVSGEIQLYGQGNGNVIIYLDGQAVTTLTAEVNGNTVIPYSISSSSIKPGFHTLSAAYQGVGGKSGTVQTEFNYGIGLPDLTIANIEVSKERGSDGTIPIAVTVQKGKVLPAKDIIVEVTLGNELIGEYIIPELNGENVTDTRTIPWSAGEFNGNAELKAIVNYDKRVYEYNTANNTAVVKVAIPMVPQVSGLPTLANDPRLPIIGQSTPGALICLYDSRRMIDFGYADSSGNFTLTDHCLDQGENRLRLKARNREGWESLFSDEYTVILDAAPPQIIVNNLEDNRHYNYDILPEITIEETDPAKIEYALDGQAWLPETAISAEGAHQLWITVTDIAGNRAERLINFTIDKTPPEVTIAGVIDGGYFNAPQAPVITVNDLNSVATELTLNGELYQGAAVNEDGTYLLEVLAYDQAGNTVTQQIGFTIDRTEPVIQISGVSDGETYREAVIPVIEVIEINLEEAVTLLDGQPFVSGTTITAQGSHELSVTAVDMAGNRETVTVRFKLDSKFSFSHTVFCNGLQVNGNVSVENIFCNGEVKINGNNVRIDYLGSTAPSIPNISKSVVKKLETGLPAISLPEPDWDGLTKTTTLISKLDKGKTYSNIQYNGSLKLNGNQPQITGLLVVNGDLTINGNLNFKDLAIFCTGKVNIMGNVKMNGLIYTKEMKVAGNSKLTGAVLVSGNLVLEGNASCKTGDVQQNGHWLR